MTEPKRSMEQVKYVYSAVEKAAIADRLVEVQFAIWQQELNKAEVLADIGTEMKKLDKEKLELNSRYRCGYEMRETEVLTVYDEPQRGMKRIIVLATSEVLREERMSDEELQRNLDFSGEP